MDKVEMDSRHPEACGNAQGCSLPASTAVGMAQACLQGHAAIWHAFSTQRMVGFSLLLVLTFPDPCPFVLSDQQSTD
jgi:hypothetical protein